MSCAGVHLEIWNRGVIFFFLLSFSSSSSSLMSQMCVCWCARVCVGGGALAEGGSNPHVGFVPSHVSGSLCGVSARPLS
jgi:hypothetical protein